MIAAYRQILIDRLDAVDRLRREFERDIAAPFLDERFTSAIEGGLSWLEGASLCLLAGLMKLDDAARVSKPETPPIDRTVLK